MKRYFISCLLLFVSTINLRSLPMMTNLSINGAQIDKYVKEIQYADGKMTLMWSDGSYTRNNLGQLMVNLACTEDIDKVRIGSISGLQKDFLLIEGLDGSSELAVYDVTGRKFISAKASGVVTKIDIRSLNTGIYILQFNTTAIRFTKQ